jgi:hypothetical protein
LPFPGGSDFELAGGSVEKIFKSNLVLSDYSIAVKMKKISFSQVKKQEAENRMAAIRRARRSPAAAAAEQRRASLVGNGAKWRITNLNEFACAMAKKWE